MSVNPVFRKICHNLLLISTNRTRPYQVSTLLATQSRSDNHMTERQLIRPTAWCCGSPATVFIHTQDVGIQLKHKLANPRPCLLPRQYFCQFTGVVGCLRFKKKTKKNPILSDSYVVSV